MDTITTTRDLLTCNGSARPVTVSLDASELKLIAAAPDMYEALKELCDALPSAEYMRAEGKEEGPGLKKMRAAIAKASE